MLKRIGPMLMIDEFRTSQHELPSNVFTLFFSANVHGSFYSNLVAFELSKMYDEGVFLDPERKGLDSGYISRTKVLDNGKITLRRIKIVYVSNVHFQNFQMTTKFKLD